MVERVFLVLGATMAVGYAWYFTVWIVERVRIRRRRRKKSGAEYDG